MKRPRGGARLGNESFARFRTHIFPGECSLPPSSNRSNMLKKRTKQGASTDENKFFFASTHGSTHHLWPRKQIVLVVLPPFSFLYKSITKFSATTEVVATETLATGRQRRMLTACAHLAEHGAAVGLLEHGREEGRQVRRYLVLGGRHHGRDVLRREHRA